MSELNIPTCYVYDLFCSLCHADAYKVARNCNGEIFCLEVSTDQVNTQLHSLHHANKLTDRLLLYLILQISGFELFNFVARAYLEPPTKVGPDGSELLTPVVLHYTRRSGLNIIF